MSQLVCKKCGGNHLTIKCGKKKKQNDSKSKIDNKSKDGYKSKIDNKSKINKFKTNTKYKEYKGKRSEKFTIKISNLPSDITIQELNELLLPWGHIGNINFGKSYNIVCYIDFYNKEEAIYFVQALDRTPFDNLIINVELLK